MRTKESMSSLVIEKFPSAAGDNAPLVVLLHGWQSDSRSWDSFLPFLRKSFNVWRMDLPGCGRNAAFSCETAHQAVALIAEALPAQTILLGWSLGGNIALQIAQDYREKCSAVITVATNPSFVARDNWPGMAPEIFSAFLDGCAAHPEKTRQRFLGLQAKGDSDEKPLLRFLREQPLAEWSSHQLVNGLRWLADLDARNFLSGLSQPILQLFSRNDQLVPLACAEAVRENAANIVVEIIEQSSHLPFVTQADAVISAINRFLSESSLLSAQNIFREKKAVAQSFGRAAGSYDQVAALQRNSASTLLSVLPQNNDLNVLDIGCGSGLVTETLARQLPDAAVFAIDLSEEMVRYSRKTYPEKQIEWLCADAENLPFADQSMDMIFSNLVIQWCENPAALFSEMMRVLKPGGEICIATLGPETLQELRSAWAEVDDAEHVNRFTDKTILQKYIDRAGLQIELWQERIDQQPFTQLRDLLMELKLLGAHNVNPGRPRGLTGRKRLQQLDDAYPRSERHQYVATWQLWFLNLRKPE
jgi:malonyl-CoA O-methyltransferase